MSLDAEEASARSGVLAETRGGSFHDDLDSPDRALFFEGQTMADSKRIEGANGLGRLWKRESGFWWITYWRNGKRRRESLRTKNLREAKARAAIITGREGMRRLGYASLRTNKESIAKLIPVFLEAMRQKHRRRREERGVQVDGGPDRTHQAYLYAFSYLPELLGRPFERRAPRDSEGVVAEVIGALGGKVLRTVDRKVVEAKGGLSVEAITPERAIDWRRRVKLGDRTKNSILSELKHLLTWAASKARLIRENPLEGVETGGQFKPERHVTTAEELIRLLEASREHLKPVWITFVWTGLRRQEAIDLRWGDLSFALPEPSLHVAKSKTRKGVRDIPLHHEVIEALRTWRCLWANYAGREPEQSDHVFLTAKGHPWRGDSVLKAYQRCRDKASLPSGCLHELRHTFASYLEATGVSVGTMMDLLGHATATMIYQRYRHPVSTGRRAIMALTMTPDAEGKPEGGRNLPQQQPPLRQVAGAQ